MSLCTSRVTGPFTAFIMDSLLSEVGCYGAAGGTPDGARHSPSNSCELVQQLQQPHQANNAMDSEVSKLTDAARAGLDTIARQHAQIFAQVKLAAAVACAAAAAHGSSLPTLGGGWLRRLLLVLRLIPCLALMPA